MEISLMMTPFSSLNCSSSATASQWLAAVVRDEMGVQLALKFQPDLQSSKSQHAVADEKLPDLIVPSGKGNLQSPGMLCRPNTMAET